MEGRRFDSIVRSLVQSRRSFLGLGLGATIGIAPLLADAKKHKHKKKKKKKKCLDFEDGECQPFGEFCNPFGSPCCNCVPCIPRGHDDDESVIYRCETLGPDDPDD